MKLNLLLLGLVWFCVSCSTEPTKTKTEREPAGGSVFNWSTIQSSFQGNGWVLKSPSDLNKYKDLYFMSDIHGQIISFANLLYKAGLVDSGNVDSNGNASGNWKRHDALLVLAGDYVDGGSYSKEVLDWIGKLQGQAGGDMIVLLGNHEAEFLAKQSFKAPETEHSFGKTDLNTYIKQVSQFKLGAVIGSWFVAHSGYIVPDSGSLPKWLGAMSTARGQGQQGFVALSDKDGKGVAGVLERHDWWDDNHDKLSKTLSDIGINGFIAGHEPKLFGDDKNKILISNAGWAVKIDTGLKESEGTTHDGEMLHCKMSDISGGSAGGLKQLKQCSRLEADGSTKSL